MPVHPPVHVRHPQGASPSFQQQTHIPTDTHEPSLGTPSPPRPHHAQSLSRHRMPCTPSPALHPRSPSRASPAAMQHSPSTPRIPISRRLPHAMSPSARTAPPGWPPPYLLLFVQLAQVIIFSRRPSHDFRNLPLLSALQILLAAKLAALAAHPPPRVAPLITALAGGAAQLSSSIALFAALAVALLVPERSPLPGAASAAVGMLLVLTAPDLPFCLGVVPVALGVEALYVAVVRFRVRRGYDGGDAYLRYGSIPVRDVLQLYAALAAMAVASAVCVYVVAYVSRAVVRCVVRDEEKGTGDEGGGRGFDKGDLANISSPWFSKRSRVWEEKDDCKHHDVVEDVIVVVTSEAL